MIDYAALKAELLKSDLVGLSDADAAAKLTTDTVAGPRVPIAVSALRYWGGGNGVIAAVKAAADDAAHPAHAPALALWLALQGDPSKTIDLDDPQSRALIAAYVTSGVMTAAQQTDLLSLADTVRERGVAVFGVRPSALDIAHARSL